MPESNRPLLAITMGDPAGVGPEVIVGAWSDARIHEQTRPIVLGHPEILRRAVRLLQSKSEVVELAESSLGNVPTSPSVIPCVKACGDDVLDVPTREVSAKAG